jgi:hypothetical protein
LFGAPGKRSACCCWLFFVQKVFKVFG